MSDQSIPIGTGWAGPVRIGLHSGQQHGSFTALVDLWQRAERLGYDWISLFDHLRPHLYGAEGACFEAATSLAGVAPFTSTIRCALLVSAVTLRHPAMTANIAATLDHVSGGRLEFGVGAGGPDLAYAEYGLPFPPAGVRVAMLAEACEVMRRLWTQESTTFEGRHFRLRDAHLRPKPLQPHLPIIVGGEGPGLLHAAARWADTWNTLASDREHYARLTTRLDEACRAAGRDPRSIRRSVTFRAVLGETADEARDRYEAVLRSAPAEVRGECLVVGTPADCLDALRPYLELGVGDFVLAARAPIDWATVALMAEQVAPALRAEASELNAG